MFRSAQHDTGRPVRLFQAAEKAVSDMKKERLDAVLHERGMFESRESARRAVMAGEVQVEGFPSPKPSTLVTEDTRVTVDAKPRFVGRGGLKLEGALDHFGVDVRDRVAIDIGASTGGFTDCLLQRGARKVFAIDVGHNQLAWKIRQDPRVVVMEKVNARHLQAGDLPESGDLCVIDVAFISLTLILPSAFELVTAGADVFVLIKPQFELERADVSRGGIVREPELHQKAQDKIVRFVGQLGHEVIGIVPAVITGTDGNQEFFACLRKR